jgi:hypothetical protein
MTRLVCLSDTHCKLSSPASAHVSTFLDTSTAAPASSSELYMPVRPATVIDV